MILYTLEYKFLFNYLSYAILSATTRLIFTFHYFTFIVTCHRQRSTKLSTSYANVGTRAFPPMVDNWAYYVNWVVALNMA